MCKVRSLWKGVYRSFEEAGGDYDAFETEIWINNQKNKVKREYEGLEKPQQITKGATARDYPLPLIVSMLLTQQEKVSVLDFGGGMGAQYLELISKLPNAKDSVNFLVVDGGKTLENIPEEMRAYANLSFYESLESLNDEVDILHIGSTLQYIEDWKGLLTFLIKKFNPNYFVFSDLLAGDIPTFVSHQIFYNKRIPHLFLNLEEFIGFFTEELGFQLSYKAKYIHPILNQEKIFPNYALPEKYRIDRTMNMYFTKG